MRIRWKIIIPVILIVLICSISSALISEYMITENINHELRVEIGNSSKSAALLLDKFFNDNKNLAYICADNQQAIDILHKYDNKNIKDNKELIAEIQKDPDVVNYCNRLGAIAKRYNLIALYLLDKNGEIISGQSVSTIGGFRGDRDYFKKTAAEKKIIVSKVLKSRTTGNLTVVVCAPILNDSDDFTGGILIAFDYLEFYNKIANSISHLENEYPFIFTTDKHIIAHPDTSQVEKYAVDEAVTEPFFDQLLSKESGIVEYEFPVGSGKQRITAIEKLQSIDWRIGYSGNKELRLKTAGDITNVIIIAAVIAVIIMCFTVFILINIFIERPVIVLVDHLDEYCQGNIKVIDKHLAILTKIRASKDEFGRMCRAVGKFREYLQKNIKVAAEIANGNLCPHIEVNSDKDLFGNEFSRMTYELRTAFKQLDKFTTEVTERVLMVKTASKELSDEALQQESSLIQISANVSQMGNKAKENANDATLASEITNRASSATQQGNELMKNLSQAISTITSRAEDTQKVVKSIDDIAFQTNLLALNAAVESARAGIHGKGFSVVAQEVKNLAMRSADAARETAKLIERMMQEVNSGNQIANKTVEILEDISAKITEATEIVDRIELASKEQASAVNEVNIGITNLEQITVENTVSSRKTAEASTDMNAEVMRLMDIVSRFKHHSDSSSERARPHKAAKQLDYSK